MERHFLVVAADGTVREALAAALRKKGCTVTLAESGAQAERVVQSVAVQAALVESHLPDVTTSELRTRLRDLRSDCRVVELTGFSLVRNTPEMLRFGASDYLLRAEQIFDLLQPTEMVPTVSSWEQPTTQ